MCNQLILGSFMATIAFFVLSLSLCFCTHFSFQSYVRASKQLACLCCVRACLLSRLLCQWVGHINCVLRPKRAPFHKCWFIAISGRDMKINIHSYLSMVWIVLALHNRACFGFGIVVGYKTTTTTTTIWNGSFGLVHFGCRLFFGFFTFSALWHSDENKTCLRSTRNKQNFDYWIGNL